MQMSLAYLRETVDVIAATGWAHAVSERRVVREAREIYVAEVHDLRRPDGAHLRLEALHYASGEWSWYAELWDFGGLRSSSYRLDSWKHRRGSVELKFYADPSTSEGLSLVLELE